MNQTNRSTANTSSKRYTKLAQCPTCYRLLCKRVPIHDETEETYIIYIKHRGLRLYTYGAYIVCLSCGTASEISAEKGIIRSERNENVDLPE